MSACCPYYTCGEVGNDRCGGCCRDLGYCQSNDPDDEVIADRPERDE